MAGVGGRAEGGREEGEDGGRGLDKVMTGVGGDCLTLAEGARALGCELGDPKLEKDCAVTPAVPPEEDAEEVDEDEVVDKGQQTAKASPGSISQTDPRGQGTDPGPLPQNNRRPAAF